MCAVFDKGRVYLWGRHAHKANDDISPAARDVDGIMQEFAAMCREISAVAAGELQPAHAATSKTDTGGIGLALARMAFWAQREEAQPSTGEVHPRLRQEN